MKLANSWAYMYHRAVGELVAAQNKNATSQCEIVPNETMSQSDQLLSCLHPGYMSNLSASMGFGSYPLCTVATQPGCLQRDLTMNGGMHPWSFSKKPGTYKEQDLPGRCFLCGAQGHWVRECPHGRPQQSPTSDEMHLSPCTPPEHDGLSQIFTCPNHSQTVASDCWQPFWQDPALEASVISKQDTISCCKTLNRDCHHCSLGEAIDVHNWN